MDKTLIKTVTKTKGLEHSSQTTSWKTTPSKQLFKPLLNGKCENQWKA